MRSGGLRNFQNYFWRLQKRVNACISMLFNSNKHHVTLKLLKPQKVQKITELQDKVCQHCYKYKLTKPGSGEFLVATMFKQDLNSAIENLQEQELEKNYCKKNYAGTSIEKIQYLFLHYYNNVPT